jgi:hypothetical protein
MVNRGLIFACFLGVFGCGQSVEVRGDACERAWLTYSTAPFAAEGAYMPLVHRDALAGWLAPVDYTREVHVLTLGTAPGWGCEAPSLFAVGVLEELPPGDPWEALEELPEGGGAADMGGGFELARIELLEAVTVDEGQGAWIVQGLERTSCGVKAQLDLTAPRGMHWTKGGGWAEVDAQLVMGADGECW